MSDNEDIEFHSCDEEEFSDSILQNLDLMSEVRFRLTNHTSYFIKNGKEFILSVKPWTFNNPLNGEHIRKIYEQLKEDSYLTGVFSVVCLNDESIVLIDGHHRHQALIELLQDGYEEDIPLEVHCYPSDTIESEKTVSLFTKLNNTKPFRADPEIVVLTIEIIKKLKEVFPKNIKSVSKRVIYTNILEKDLSDLLQKKLKSIRNPREDKIYDQILTFNEEYKSRAETIVKRNKKQDWIRVRQRLLKNNCYLGIVPISEWINKLE